MTDAERDALGRAWVAGLVEAVEPAPPVLPPPPVDPYELARAIGREIAAALRDAPPPVVRNEVPAPTVVNEFKPPSPRLLRVEIERDEDGLAVGMRQVEE